MFHVHLPVYIKLFDNDIFCVKKQLSFFLYQYTCIWLYGNWNSHLKMFSHSEYNRSLWSVEDGALYPIEILWIYSKKLFIVRAFLIIGLQQCNTHQSTNIWWFIVHKNYCFLTGLMIFVCLFKPYQEQIILVISFQRGLSISWYCSTLFASITWNITKSCSSGCDYWLRLIMW